MQNSGRPIITLTTDFGLRDAYAGSMKGVILSMNPQAVVVDLSHEIPPQNIREAAFLLEAAYPYFPKGTIHVVVVDPGVGSRRRILCARTPSGYFLAPDNGVLTAVLRREKTFALREVSNPSFFREQVSSTFHGRDKFAPAAAHLSKRDIFVRLGKRIDGYQRINWSEPVLGKKGISGAVLHIDRFGNLISNIRQEHLVGFHRRPSWVQIGAQKVRRWGAFYAEGRRGELMALVSSTGYLEIAVPEGSAVRKTGARTGTPIHVRF